MLQGAIAAVLLSGVSAKGLSGLPRGLLQRNVVDCGMAYQPCCQSGDTCAEVGLTCLARQGGTRCEPCGTPFSQPCPDTPYCGEEALIPTTRAQTALHIMPPADACNHSVAHMHMHMHMLMT